MKRALPRVQSKVLTDLNDTNSNADDHSKTLPFPEEERRCVRIALEIEYPNLAPRQWRVQHTAFCPAERSALAIGQFAILFPPSF